MADIKKRKIILILIASVVIAGVVVMCLFFFFNKDKHILDGPGMEYDPTYDIVECSYYSGGGMENSYIRYEMKLVDDSIVTVERTEKKLSDPDGITQTVTVSYDAITKIRDICRECGTLNWGELPTTDLLLEDAPTTSITIRVRDTANEYYDRFITVKDSHILPDKGKDFFTRIYNVLETNFEQGAE